jgi:hypothetical protein
MKPITSLTLLMLLLSLTSSICLACECVQVSAPDTKKWLKQSKGAIFTGEVIKIEEIQMPLPDRPEYFYLKRQVTFRVIKSWKNADSDEMVIRTGIGGGDCGIRFMEGQKYLVDAYELNGSLETGICTSTQRLSDAAKLIKELDAIVEAERKPN